MYKQVFLRQLYIFIFFLGVYVYSAISSLKMLFILNTLVINSSLGYCGSSYEFSGLFTLGKVFIVVQIGLAL